jgi:hypothetical protein
MAGFGCGIGNELKSIKYPKFPPTFSQNPNHIENFQSSEQYTKSMDI